MTKPIDTNEIRRKVNSGYYYDKDVTIGVLCDEIDRLRGEKPQGKTVRVRFPGMIDGNGEVIINNYHRDRKGMEHHSMSSWPRSSLFWLTADLPVPEEVTVEAEVE